MAGVLGTLLMDAMNRASGYGAGPRFALGLAVLYFLLGALLLKPVVEPSRVSGVPLSAVTGTGNAIPSTVTRSVWSQA